MGLGNIRKAWGLILMWALLLGTLVSLPADWGQWDRFPINLLWRVGIVALGGVVGLVFDHFAGFYVQSATNVIESMNVVKFSEGRQDKILRASIFMLSLVAAIFSFFIIR